MSPVSSAEDVRALGLEVGDVVCPEPRTRITKSGYIKAAFWMINSLWAFCWALADSWLTAALSRSAGSTSM